MEGESAQEAAARAARVLTDPIAAAAHLRTADQLEPGSYCKVCGDWYRFEGMTDRGQMRLVVPGPGSDDREFHYGPSDGEVFVWHLGSF